MRKKKTKWKKKMKRKRKRKMKEEGDEEEKVLFRPVKDLNGIPGAKSLCICLTGYERQYREDIMIMAGLMGAHFLKPLVPHKVTHLICYDFESEKYKLAKMTGKIKLVNHRWLEDSLKAWELLPEFNYKQSGSELEMIEAEAKDSEEEAENEINIGQYGERNFTSSRILSASLISKASELPKQVWEVSQSQQIVSASKNLSEYAKNIFNKKISFSAGKEFNPAKSQELHDREKKNLEMLPAQVSGAYSGDAMGSAVSFPYNGAPSIWAESSGLAFNQIGVSYSGKRDNLSCTGKSARTSPVSVSSETLSHINQPPQANNDFDFGGIQIDKNEIHSHHGEGDTSALPKKRMETRSITILKPTAPSLKSSVAGSPSTTTNPEKSMIGAPQMKYSPFPKNSCNHSNQSVLPNIMENQSANLPAYLNSKKESLKQGQLGKGNLTSDSTEFSKKVNMLDFATNKSTPETSSRVLKHCNVAAGPGGDSRESMLNDFVVVQTVESQKLQKDGEISCIIIKSLPKGKLAKRNSGSRPKLSTGGTNTVICSLYLDKTVEKPVEIGNSFRFEEAIKETFKGTIHSRNEIDKDTSSMDIETTGSHKDAVEQDKTASGKENEESYSKAGEKMAKRRKLISSKNKENPVFSVKQTETSGKDKVGVELEIKSHIVKMGENAKQVQLTACKQKCEALSLSKTKKAIDAADQMSNLNGDLTEGRNRVSDLSKKILVSVNEEKELSGVEMDVDKNEKKTAEKIGAENVKGVDHSTNKTKNKPISVNKPEKPLDAEKNKEKVNKTSGKDKVGVEVEIKSDVGKIEEKAKQVQVTASKRKREAISLSNTKKPIDAADEMPNSNGDLSEWRNYVSRSSKKIPVSVNKENEISGIETDIDKNEKKIAEKMEGETNKEKVIGRRDRSANKTNTKAISVDNPEKLLDAETNKEKVNKKMELKKTKEVECLSSKKESKTLSMNKPDITVYAEKNEKKTDKMMGSEKAKGVRRPGSKLKTKASSIDKQEKSVDVEKENKSIKDGSLSVNFGKSRTKNATLKSNKTSTEIDINFGGTNLDKVQSSNLVSSEPVWFLLSGTRIQRKESRKIVRQLKGRLCKDSHNWSYQATHLIVPDPVRRTEKFFAAAASGRWILKKEYLTASSQAGKFLAEEPYEWFNNGLGKDGAINFEASRKWRLLRERTGYGAFYGMHIIIYGDHFIPLLDTLKRVVNAGDGTILATSPPYTRFLKSDVDFAVVNSTMPRVDYWVQDFLRHEIPCITADYLVDYVCKTGYPLEKHVLYGTCMWAENSFNNLLRRSEEIYEVSTPIKHNEVDDLSCIVCGSRDRGEVMLICGSEDGPCGCEIGTHIDCCDPPLEAVPEEDWFCAECCESINSTKCSKRSKKRSSVSKPK
ncbi:hypothetical protein GIB67_014163 [Kingdonia uniflora]|uniref:BRCT domain-containing protein n=1 Tax=Kingdonia uniflora TaxID=39325 RepID=A0A7J7ND78_9MAGN|nr:hypothetical protein GIB67_014163 [Kingdonia uniflora]